MNLNEDEGFTIEARWVGRGFQPSNAAMEVCQTKLRPWEVVKVTVHQGRSMKSHRHMFPWLQDAWLSLPEEHKDAPWAASPDHLRKWALIKTGFHDIRIISVSDPSDAARVAAFARALDPYAVVVIHGGTVLFYTALSQSMKAMGKDRFQASKTAVLNHVAGVLGIHPEELAQWGKKLKGKRNERPCDDPEEGDGPYGAD